MESSNCKNRENEKQNVKAKNYDAKLTSIFNNLLAKISYVNEAETEIVR